MARAIPAPPEQGQLVHVRQRRYIVTDVAKSALPVSLLRSTDNGSQHPGQDISQNYQGDCS